MDQNAEQYEKKLFKVNINSFNDLFVIILSNSEVIMKSC